MSLPTPVRALLESQNAIWVLIDVDGSGRLVIPWGMDAREVYGDKPPDWLSQQGSPLADVIACAVRFSQRKPGWAVLVSVLKTDETAADRVIDLLPPARYRELGSEDFGMLGELQMEVAMGEWARERAARVFLVMGAAQ